MASITKQNHDGGKDAEFDEKSKGNLPSSPNIRALNGREPSISVQSSPETSWKSYFWDTFDKSPEERRFLFKLDAILMTLASLGYFIKYLDQVCYTS